MVRPYSIASASARQLASMMFGAGADRGPPLGAVVGVDQHARDGARAVAAVQDADLVVGELERGQHGIVRQ